MARTTTEKITAKVIHFFYSPNCREPPGLRRKAESCLMPIDFTSQIFRNIMLVTLSLNKGIGDAGSTADFRML